MHPPGSREAPADGHPIVAGLSWLAPMVTQAVRACDARREARAAQQQLAEVQRTYHLLAESLLVGAFVVRRGRMQVASDSLHQMLG